VEAGEPRLRAEHVQVGGVEEGVDHAQEEQERRDLGKEESRHAELSGDEEGAQHIDAAFEGVVLSSLGPANPSRDLGLGKIADVLLLAASLALVACWRHGRKGLQRDDGAEDGNDWHEDHNKEGNLLRGDCGGCRSGKFRISTGSGVQGKEGKARRQPSGRKHRDWLTYPASGSPQRGSSQICTTL
jgi:hypothetical protein